MQKHQCLPLGTSPTLPFPWVVTVSLPRNITPCPTLLSPFPTPQMILLMSRSATPLQAPLVAIGLDPQSPRKELKTTA